MQRIGLPRKTSHRSQEFINPGAIALAVCINFELKCLLFWHFGNYFSVTPFNLNPSLKATVQEVSKVSYFALPRKKCKILLDSKSINTELLASQIT